VGTIVSPCSQRRANYYYYYYTPTD